MGLRVINVPLQALERGGRGKVSLGQIARKYFAVLLQNHLVEVSPPWTTARPRGIKPIHLDFSALLHSKLLANFKQLVVGNRVGRTDSSNTGLLEERRITPQHTVETPVFRQS